MRKLGFFALVLLIFGGAIGCDSGGDDEPAGPTDAEIFIGNWRLSSLLLNGQDFSALLLQNATVDIDFEASAFNMDIMTDSMSTIAGTYSIDDVQKTITLTSSTFDNPVPLGYTINSENQISLTTDDVALFIGLTGIDPASLGLVIQTIGLVVQRTG